MDPELYCREALAPADRSSAFDRAFTERERLRCARSLGADRLVAVLSGGDRSWKEFLSRDRKSALFRFVLGNATWLLRPDQAGALLKLRTNPEMPWDLRAELAIAASRLAPGNRCEILGSADDEGDTATELARWCPERARVRVREDFYHYNNVRAGILDAIADAGPNARALLRDIVLDERFPRGDYSVVSGAMIATRSVLPTTPLECAALWDPSAHVRARLARTCAKKISQALARTRGD